MAKVQNRSIDKVGSEGESVCLLGLEISISFWLLSVLILLGPGLVFIVYPEAIATMPGSNFWAVIFFLMLITLGLDSTFGGMEAIITALCDEYPRILGRNREVFVAILLLFVFTCSIPTCTQVNDFQLFYKLYLLNFN